MKLTIFNVFSYLIRYNWDYSQLSLHSLVTIIVITNGCENARSGKCRRGNVQSGKSPSGKCPVGKVSVEELPFGEVSVCYLSMRKCQSGNCPYTNLSIKRSQRNCFKDLYKRAMTSSFRRKPCRNPFSLIKLLTDLQILKEWPKVLLKRY